VPAELRFRVKIMRFRGRINFCGRDTIHGERSGWLFKMQLIGSVKMLDPCQSLERNCYMYTTCIHHLLHVKHIDLYFVCQALLMMSQSISHIKYSEPTDNIIAFD